MTSMRLLILALLNAASPIALAGENAAPSSHLVFDDNFEGDIIVNEVRVPADGEARFTYYETLGWRGKAGGYAGIQAHPKAHNYIFSIWDHKSHTAPIVAVHHGPGTLTEKFGGEGTGLKSWNFELGWETDTWYTLVSRCWPVGDHTYYGYWVRSGATKEWTHMITMDVAAKDAYFQGGTDAFIEDWLETGKNARTTNLRGGWKRKRDGSWFPFGSGRYSVNAWDLKPGKRSYNFKTNWNGGVKKDEGGEYYFMTAGGTETKASVENPSKHSIKRSEKRPSQEPMRLVRGKAIPGADGKLDVTWVVDSKMLPQYSFKISAYDNEAGHGKPLAELQRVEPHARNAALSLPDKVDWKGVHLQLSGQDLFGNQSPVLNIAVGE